MANKLEKIAENKKKAVLAKQDADVDRFAKRVALEVVGNIKTGKDDGLKESVGELAVAVAQAIVLSNQSFDEKLDDKFTGLIKAVKLNRPDNSSLVKLNKEIGVSLAKFERALDRLELSPQISLTGLTREELKGEVDKILSRMPSTSKREVSIAYENATADKYINVRLTDGVSHYKAFGGTVSGGREGGATETKQDALIALVTSLLAAQKTEWIINDQEETGTYKYYGFESPGGTWKISRKTLADNSWRYATGSSDYATAWTNRASQTYGTAGATF